MDQIDSLKLIILRLRPRLNLLEEEKRYKFNINDVIIQNPVIRSLNEEVKRRRILIVDDEPFNLLTLKTMLGQLNIPNIESIIDSAQNG